MILLTLLICIAFIMSACSSPTEGKGRVSFVSAGNIFYVDGFGQVSLAHVKCPPTTTHEGVHSKEYSLENLLNVVVFLDIDNKTGINPDGSTLCVVYLSSRNGTPMTGIPYNRMIIDAGYGSLVRDQKTEFDPDQWWR
jgi:hypothetical protein